MYAKVYGSAIHGLNGYIVEVEVNIGLGLPTFEIVGLPNTSIREAKERVRAAIENSGLSFPMKRIIVNLAPAHLKKESAGLDLPIAIGILAASNQLSIESVENIIFCGELSLNGEIRHIHGVLAMALGAYDAGYTAFYTSLQNMAEAKLSKMNIVRGYISLTALVQSIQTGIYHKPLVDSFKRKNTLQYNLNLQDVQGQFRAKRALEIAAAGGHNMLMIGPPGAGKTMIAKRITTILPPLTADEALEVTKIYSVAGLLSNDGIMTERPFRSPHHTITATSMIGGGNMPKPGEVTLSHKGVLFLDELPEFSKKVLEVLRQPLENGKVQISRVRGAYNFPADFSLIVALNPCPCGYYGDIEHPCTCTESEVTRYNKKISGPLLDRIDLFIAVKKPSYEEISTFTSGESSDVIRERVIHVRNVQKKRYKGTPIVLNANIGHRELEKYVPMTQQAKNMLALAFKKMHLSARSYDRIIKVARTIADLDNKEIVDISHISESIGYREALHKD